MMEDSGGGHGGGMMYMPDHYAQDPNGTGFIAYNVSSTLCILLVEFYKSLMKYKNIIEWEKSTKKVKLKRLWCEEYNVYIEYW